MFDWNAIGSVATAIGVFIGVYQLWEAKSVAMTEFEDSLDQQYRQLARDIPVDALIGRPMVSESLEVRELIYNYLDLCNEQVSLRSRNRIRKDTWLDWSAGIRESLEKTAFKLVWDEVKREAPGLFSFLEQMENTNFKDPYQGFWTSK